MVLLDCQTPRPAMTSDDESEILNAAILAGDDPTALDAILRKYQPRLERILSFRIDPLLRARIDAADVLQEAFLEASQRIEDYRGLQGEMPFFLWLRYLALQKLNQLRRYHLGTQARAAGQECGAYNPVDEQGTSVALAARLVGDLTSPSEAAMRAEDSRRIEGALRELNSMDREILALRHYEQLSNIETARLLSLSESAASNRYFRAVRRLKQVLEGQGE